MTDTSQKGVEAAEQLNDMAAAGPEQNAVSQAGSLNPGPLHGLRVVDMTSLGMGPLAAQILGDYGADVIKLEPITGDVFRHVLPQRSPGMSHAFIQFNRNKRSVALDLKTPDGMAVMRRLLAGTDVLLSNLRPAAMKALGLGYEAMRAIRPDLIFCAAYGYSERGPYAGRPAADDTIQAMSGLAGLQRMATGAPQFVPSVVADKAVGQAIVSAVMGAVIHRMKTGQGQAIEVPMFETMVAFVMPEHVAGRTFVPPLGGTGYGRIMNANRRPFCTKDGLLAVMPYTTPQWLRFFRLIGREDLATDPGMADPMERNRRFEELYGIVDAAMPGRTTAEWIDALLREDILFGKVNSPDELIEDPHLAELEMFPLVRHPSEGMLRLIGFPITFSATPNTLRQLPPRLGQHTRELLAEIGFSQAEIDGMHARKAALCD
ncbi:CoA transferase [Cupriavidus taiwanensis]|uniref:CaiB/BaiF CoA transferase family protein n=1 Tax=Cupriavidus taiwanensis TaxID=164546 RepID=UPI000E199FAC|nr:CoA transferase [Cupriavidus taiwanensis]SOZ33803.1 CoA-transferase family III family protein 49 [Cupriavidus taiwanensis]SPA38498.1 CoA-transferase family III family protein 49 [Cupriavidus taiwanensis]